MLKLIVKKEDNILKYLNIFEGLGFNKIQALFRKKEIKVNGKKVNSDFFVKKGDIIEIFCKENYFFNIKTVYEDDNIIIVNKPKKLEIITETKNISLLNLINPNFFAVHRLDFNTEGLVLIAKNETSKNELDIAFKNSNIKKTYITICKNYPTENQMIFKDYIEKFNNFVKIYANKTINSKIVKTKIECLKKQNGYSLIKVDLLTGRTHQIRAHLAFHNLFVLGDEKYGNFIENKKLNLKNQILRCYKLELTNLGKNLEYLNNKIFEIDFSDISSYFDNLKES